MAIGITQSHPRHWELTNGFRGPRGVSGAAPSGFARWVRGPRSAQLFCRACGAGNCRGLGVSAAGVRARHAGDASPQRCRRLQLHCITNRRRFLLGVASPPCTPHSATTSVLSPRSPLGDRDRVWGRVSGRGGVPTVCGLQPRSGGMGEGSGGSRGIGGCLGCQSPQARWGCWQVALVVPLSSAKGVTPPGDAPGEGGGLEWEDVLAIPARSPLAPGGQLCCPSSKSTAEAQAEALGRDRGVRDPLGFGG